jgi:DNA topoisomerase VI subunit B
MSLQVGVFVSIVSTKIPFKGAGKEYIGDDIEEMVVAVKHALQACGVQVLCHMKHKRSGN